MRHSIWLLAAVVLLAAGVTASAEEDRTAAIRGCRGTYSAPPRKADGHVDAAALLGDLADLHADTYSWLVWMAGTDWEDLQAFLPQARARGVRVWVTLVPPSESPPKTRRYSEPFKTDYERWAVEIAKLSVREPNLVAWSIDDFTHNLAVFTPEKTKAMVEAARAINPRLAFVPCCYYRGTAADFGEKYGGSVDGILFPYRHESVKANLTDADAVKAEVETLRKRVGAKTPIIVDVYSTRHSRLGDSTAEYVRQVMTEAKAAADGNMVYCHPRPTGESGEKYRVVKEVYSAAAVK